MTILLTPFMSCTAKVPIYAMLSKAFFPDYAALVMIALYFGGIALGILMALLLRHTAFKGNPVPFVMELPNYRLPGLKNVAMLLWDKAKDFLSRAFTIIFIATIVIWFLQNFDSRINVVIDSKNSLLAMLASLIAPLFKPLGFGNWQISTALITGFMTPAAALSFLVFVLLYSPCVAAVSTIKREMGGKWAIGVVIGQFVLAWLATLLIHGIALIFV